MAVLIACTLIPLLLHAEEAADCTIHAGSCTKQAGAYSVTLDISPKPVRHMADLAFSLTVTPCTELPDTLVLDLSMPGMHMGLNRVFLSRTSGCTYRGKGIIVRCMSGRTLWRVTVLSPLLNNPSFTFNVRN